MTPRFVFAALFLAATLGASDSQAQRLRVAVIQMAQAPTITGNCDRIVSGIAEAAQRGARVVVFPEEALMGQGSDDLAGVEEAMASIRRATRENNVYVMFGAATYSPVRKRNNQWMAVLGPDGRDLLRYDKLYDVPNATMPGVFEIDGIPCSTMLCADRWLRGLEEIPVQQGAKVNFELSCNSFVEWVAPFEWYWYVPRAVRNNVWVIFANTGNLVSGAPNHPGASLRHGHSAIIAPDGRIVARSSDDVATVVMADIDVREATRAEALARAAHPALRPFWAAGVKRQTGQEIFAPTLTPFKSPVTDITIAAAQVVDDVPAMEAKIREAHRRHANIIVFPARAAPESALSRLQAAARDNSIMVVFGAEHRVDGRMWNSAFVLGSDGTVLTRYDQLSAASPYQPGTDPTTMWFRVKGVPAVVTIGRDGLWNELAELAAAAGAQIQVHLEHDRATGATTTLRQQVWSNIASFLTFTATVNVVDSSIWDDLRGLEERRAPIGHVQPESGVVEVYSQYSANLVARARSTDELLVVTRRVNAVNLYHSRVIFRKNPQMEAWYRIGAASLQPKDFESQKTK